MATRTAKGRRGSRDGAKRERMTADDARRFGVRSLTNTMVIGMAFRCGCEAYEDTFTFGRWLAQGYAVRKGEHGTHIGVKYSERRRDAETGEEVEVGERWGTAVVFCRHQVEPVSAKQGASVK